MSTTALLDPEKVSRLGNLELIARLVVEGFLRGVHRSIHKGSSVEFAENRLYVPGDEIAKLNWRAFAKTDRLYLKEYEDESNVRVTFLMDTSASMGFGTNGITKLRYASCLAASLGQLFHRQLDAIGLITFDEELGLRIATRSSRAHYKGLIGELEKLQPKHKTSLKNALTKAAGAVSSRGLLVIFSDLLDEPGDLLRGLARFRALQSEVVVFHLVDGAELEFPFTNWTVFRDMETPRSRLKIDARWVRDTYWKNFKDHLEQIREGCRRSHIDYQLVNIATPFDEVLSQFLTARRMHGVR